MKTPTPHTCLVPVGDRFALIDRKRNSIHLLNAAAAQLWRQPQMVVSPEQAAAAAACLAWFHANGLLPTFPSKSTMSTPSTVSTVSTTPPLTELPVIFGTTPLEVAANNSAASADPFFEWIP